MPAMSVSTTPAADEIQRQMRDLRADLREEVQEIVENARVMTDWHHYVRSYPWLCLGAAAAVGYLLVPARVEVVRPDTKMLADLVRHHQVAVKTEVKPPSAGLLGGLVNMVAGMALQGALAIASHQVNQFVRGWAAQPSTSQRDMDHEEPHL
jgi:hypothetical protein